MKLRTLLLCALLAGRASAVEIVSGGTVFRDCTQLRVAGAELLFMHDSGSAHIRFDKLPAGVAEKYFGTEKLAVLRAQDKAAAEAEQKRVADLATDERDRAAKAGAAKREIEAAVASVREANVKRRAEEEEKAKAREAAAAAQRRVDDELAAAAQQDKAVRAARLADEAASNRAVEMILLVILSVLGLVFYFLPSIVGRHKGNVTAIVVLNIFLGWTFVGWVVALVWACTKDEPVRGAA
ncbi:MAG: superinfection immunity protein [Verrucomicrobiota bacterium]